MKNILIIIFSIISLFRTFFFATIINIPTDQLTIQAGINVSIIGDTVLVQPGTYYENINYNGKNITVASNYIISDDDSFISNTIINGNNNGTVVTFTNEENNTARLIGFKITNGSYSGIRCWYDCDPTLSNLIITGNTNSIGGGMNLVSASPVVSDCVITGNTATNADITGGGGVCCGDYSNPIFENVEISYNNSSAQGGGFYCSHWSHLTLIKVAIFGNSANSFGGGITCQAESNLILRKVTISRNSATAGGSIAKFNSQISIDSSIIWNNPPNSIYESGSGSINANYSDIYGGYDGNMNSDPLFVDSDNYNFNLLENSPCIDTGNPALPLDPDGTLSDMGAFYYNQFFTEFSAIPLFNYFNYEVNFIDESYGNPTNWFWDFQNDGVYDSFEQNPTYTYTQPGIYDVKLKISNETQVDSLIKYDYITVELVPPAPPAEMQIEISGNDALLQWAEVDTTIYGTPIDVDYYLVFGSYDPYEDFVFIGSTADTTYTHERVCLFNEQFFYQVSSFIGTREEVEAFLEK